LTGWIKGRSRWHRTTELRNPRRISRLIDSPIRLVKTSERKDAGWLTPTIDGSWDWNSRENAKTSLLDLDFKKEQLEYIMAKSIRRPWTLVNLPFQPLYPGGRQINWGAPQYKFQP